MGLLKGACRVDLQSSVFDSANGWLTLHLAWGTPSLDPLLKYKVIPAPLWMKPFKALVNKIYNQELIDAFLPCFKGLNMCTSGSASSCEECLMIHPKCAWCSKEVGGQDMEQGRGRGCRSTTHIHCVWKCVRVPRAAVPRLSQSMANPSRSNSEGEMGGWVSWECWMSVVS